MQMSHETSPQTSADGAVNALLNRLLELLGAALADVPAERRWVACSGGLDSMTLFHLLCRLHAAAGQAPPQVLHVDHGLQPEAAHWAQQVRGWVAAQGARCQVLRVRVDRHDPRGLEAAARRARYQAFADALPAGAVLLLAHHQDDQVETLLLRLLRGTGPAGLGGMQAHRVLGSGELRRPLLEVTRDQLSQVAQALAVPFVNDPSNLQVQHDRNYLRHQVLPIMAARWPGYRATLSRSAGLAGAQQSLLERAWMPAEADDGTLPVSVLAADADAGMTQLHLWLHRHGVLAPSRARLLELYRQARARADAQVRVELGAVEARRFAGRLYLLPRQRPSLSAATCLWQLEQACDLPHGRLAATPGQPGLDRTLSVLVVQFRQGGERFQPAGRMHSTTLKKLLQSWGVPPWERDRLPLLYHGDELVAVADLAVAEGREDRSGWALHWQPRRIAN